MKLDDQQFISALRSALHYLYEPDQLHRSPLIGFFNLTGLVDATLALQQLLLDAIQALKPGNEDSPQSKAWRLYDLLYYRYVHGYERMKVAIQLGISDRQLSREQKNAIEALALHLWKTHQFDTAQAVPSSSPGVPSQAAISDQDSQAWIQNLTPEKPSPWKPIIISVIDLLRPLIHENRVLLRYQPDESLPDLPVPQVALRHSMLTILGWLIPQARQGELIISTAITDQRLIIHAQVPGREIANSSPNPEIEAARQLIEGVGGSLEISGRLNTTELRLAVPALALTPVLVIDDNPDTIQLFQRYVQGSRYTIIGLQEPAETLPLIEKIQPRIILVDVMMPELDGWDLITQFRLNQQLQHIAIIICSILPQENLALSLGADGFLQKPVMPQPFLAMLDRHMNRLSQEPDHL